MAAAKADKSTDPFAAQKPRKKAGRPATGQRPSVTLRLSRETLAKIEAWRIKQPGATTRSDVIREAIDVLVRLGGVERTEPIIANTVKDVGAEWDAFSRRSRQIVGRKPGALKKLRARFTRKQRRRSGLKTDADI